MTRWTGYLTVVLAATVLIGCGCGKDTDGPAERTLSEAERQEISDGMVVVRLAIEDGRLDDAKEELDALLERPGPLPDDLRQQLEVLQASYATAHGPQDVPSELPDLPPAE